MNNKKSIRNTYVLNKEEETSKKTDSFRKSQFQILKRKQIYGN